MNRSYSVRFTDSAGVRNSMTLVLGPEAPEPTVSSVTEIVDEYLSACGRTLASSVKIKAAKR